jgi:uncharacterized membrane protein YbhN (UPF0104 family)
VLLAVTLYMVTGFGIAAGFHRLITQLHSELFPELSQAQVPWQTSLAAFAFVRLLTVLPVTPGGLGITELGLIGTLAATAGHQASTQVTAAVLLYRAVTYLPPIPLGAIACLTWRHAPALIRSSPRDAAPAGQSPGAGTCQRRPVPQPDEVSARHFPGQPAAPVSGRK